MIQKMNKKGNDIPTVAIIGLIMVIITMIAAMIIFKPLILGFVENAKSMVPL
jgi:hypothetical protein